jgi:hypothetical protein
MKLGSIEWRTVALPAIVLTVAAGALLWFNYVRKPAVEQYLHQANLRLLRTMGAQLNSRINGIEGNIDLALNAASAGRGLGQKQLSTFVRMYAADLMIDCFTRKTNANEKPCEGVGRLLEVAAKPPVARWQRRSAGAPLPRIPHRRFLSGRAPRSSDAVCQQLTR